VVHGIREGKIVRSQSELATTICAISFQAADSTGTDYQTDSYWEKIHKKQQSTPSKSHLFHLLSG